MTPDGTLVNGRLFPSMATPRPVPEGMNGRQPGVPLKHAAERGVTMTEFYGRPEADTIKFEKPWHRQAAYLLASGRYTQATVAEICGVTGPQVCKLMKNRWFQNTVTRLMAENGGKDIMDLFKAEATACLATLVEIRDDVKAPASVRSANAERLLNWVLGKPVQRVETDATVRSADPVQEAEMLERELAARRGAVASAQHETSRPDEEDGEVEEEPEVPVLPFGDAPQVPAQPVPKPSGDPASPSDSSRLSCS